MDNFCIRTLHFRLVKEISVMPASTLSVRQARQVSFSLTAEPYPSTLGIRY